MEPMMPDNHASKFPPEWWNERRKRDYYVDADGCVELRNGSETAKRLVRTLQVDAMRIAFGVTGY